MAYSVAVAALDRQAGPPQFDDDRTRRTDVQEMQKRVVMTVDPEIPVSHGVFPARVKVTLKNGTVHTGASNKARGMHPDLPLSDAQVDEKFRLCASSILNTTKTNEALAMLRSLKPFDLSKAAHETSFLHSLLWTFLPTPDLVSMCARQRSF